MSDLDNTDKSLFARLSNESGYSNTRNSEILNPYVNFIKHQNSQNLNNTLVSESIQMRGVEFYYLPREYVNLDRILGEDFSKFNKAWKFAGYLESFDSYSGQNSFYSKFDLQSNDEITVVINPDLFKHQTNNTEPTSGDLIYFVLDNSLFEITWVEPYTPFYQNGVNVQRRILAQKFIYSNEEIKPELQTHEHINIPEFSELELDPIRELNGSVDVNDQEYIDNEAFNDEADEFIKEPTVLNGYGNRSPFDDF